MTDPRGRLLGFNESGPIYSGLADCVFDVGRSLDQAVAVGTWEYFPWGYTKMPAPTAEAVQRAVEGFMEAARLERARTKRFESDWPLVVVGRDLIGEYLAKGRNATQEG